jgi:hypothetical protein
MPYVAILNSHQTKTPIGTDPWVQRTLEAVAYAASLGAPILTSIGLNTWELVLWAAGQRRCSIAVAVPTGLPDTERAGLLRRFAVASKSVEWIDIESVAGARSEKAWWEARDRAVLERADLVFPVSVSSSGHLAALLGGRRTRSSVDERFRTLYDPKHHHATTLSLELPTNPAIADLTGRFLIHWTRACHGPWPGESEAEFYADVIDSRDEYCRSARRTLERICSEGRIRGSAWRIGSRQPMVAFTELAPADSIPLMRWRARWSRWSFEPCGILIERDALVRLGARPVRYVDESEWRRLPSEEKPFAHRRGKNADIWPAEKEWRCAGDVDLSQLNPDSIRVIVPANAEAEKWNQNSQYEAISLFDS